MRNIKEHGRKIKLMGMGKSHILMEPFIKVNGIMMFKMDMEKNFGSIIVNIKDIIKKVKKMEMVLTLGPMVQCTQATGRITK